MDARRYHESTKHSVARLQANRHFLDWDNQPLPFKIYRGLAPIPLPRDLALPPLPALAAIAAIAASGGSQQGAVPDLAHLSRLLHWSAGITRKRVLPDGREFHFRAAACTGALYHIDLYLISGPLPDLEAGVYHFSPHDFALRRLRSGDYRAVIREATADEDAVIAAPALLVSASTFWRNAWKYQARAYRHCFWDSGTLLANLLAAAAAEELPARVIAGFVDEAVNRLLGLDGEREAALEIVAIGRATGQEGVTSPPLTDLRLETVPLSAHEVDYPSLRAMHAASCLASPDEVASWRARVVRREEIAPGGRTYHLRPLASPPDIGIAATILRRGSTRRFARSPIFFEELSTLLRTSTRGFAADFLSPGPAAALSDVYLIANAVEDLPPGAYVYDRGRDDIELLREGDMRREAGHLDLGQELAADASVNFYFLADLEPILAAFGDRGYRAAQLEAAVAGGRLYLGAYALGLGATGLTFFDDDVTHFFSPHAAGKSVLFLAAVGKPRRRAL